MKEFNFDDQSPDGDFEKWLKENADIAKQMAFDRCYAIGKEPLEVTEDDVRRMVQGAETRPIGC